jgi:hypothetical protein
MKQFCISICLVLAFTISYSQKAPGNNSLAAKVDPRVELIAIMARLAGLGGYDSKAFKLYTDDINKHFAKDSLHPAILHLKELGKKHGLGYDAVMFMPIYLNYPSFTPKVNFSSNIPHARWTKEGAEKFVPLLQQFYNDTKFNSFFNAHKDMYAETEKRFQGILSQVDLDWFPKFFGYQPKGKFSVFLSLLNGTFLYGPKVEYPNGTEELYAIMPNYKTDSLGMPVFEQWRLKPLIIHEFSHSFINHLFIKDSLAIKPYGEKIYKQVESEMNNNYYGNWLITLYESQIRASVIRYQMKHDTTNFKIKQAIEEENRLGFIWIEDLVALLGVYENNRKQYPTFTSFFPHIKSYVKDLSENMDYKFQRHADNLPKLLTTFPIANDTTDVDPSVKELTLVFDKPMQGYSFNWTDLGRDHFPIDGIIGWDKTNTQFTLKLKLKPNWNYEMIILKQGFKIKSGYSSIKEDILFKFKTK